MKRKLMSTTTENGINLKNRYNGIVTEKIVWAILTIENKDYMRK